MIDEGLLEAGLKTEAYYQHEWIDVPIKLRLEEVTSKTKHQSKKGEVIFFPRSDIKSLEAETPPVTIDPTYGIGKLSPANTVLTKVTPNHSIKETITLMLANCRS